jgi:hypothetical protein
MEAAHSIGGQSVIHRDAPKSLLAYSRFAIRKLLGIATFALRRLARNDLGSREVAIKCLT